MAVVRVRETVSVRHPDLPGQMVALKANDPYDPKDPLVRAYPWAFGSDVEQATAAPGEKRTTRTR
jgi:hypothetical protein